MDYLAKQNVAGISLGYNAAPGATPGGGALPGMKGLDLQSWRDLIKPRPTNPFPAGYGAITGESMNAIRAMQFIPNVYDIKRAR